MLDAFLAHHSAFGVSSRAAGGCRRRGRRAAARVAVWRLCEVAAAGDLAHAIGGAGDRASAAGAHEYLWRKLALKKREN